MRLLLTLLAIGFGVPSIAQEQKMVDPQIRQEIAAVIKKFDETYNKNDAAAVAGLFTPDAVLVWGYKPSAESTYVGQQAIQKQYATELAGGMNDLVSNLVQVYPIGNEITAIIEWNVAQWKGYTVTVYVRDADTWKIRMSYAISSMVPR